MTTKTRWMCALLSLAAPALAFSEPKVPGPEQLPADTWVLINWHGVTNANKVRKTNPVMRLWDDPQFAKVRAQLVARLVESMDEKEGGAQEGSSETLADILSALENPLVLGVGGDPLAPGRSAAHFYAVFNRKGKEAEWSRLHALNTPGADEEVSTYTFHGVQVRKIVKGTEFNPPLPPELKQPDGPLLSLMTKSFTATSGDYELYSDDQAEMEALIARLQDGRRSDESLLKNAAYQRSQRFRAKGPLLEAFVKLPNLLRGLSATGQQGQSRAVLRAFNFERAQGLWFSVGMQRERTQIRAALLGDTSPGSVLDLIGGNVKEFQTAAAAPAVASYTAVRFDLAAMYTTFMNALKADLKPGQSTSIETTLNSAVIAQTGMRLQAILAMISGEIGAVTTGEEKVDGASLPALLMIPANGEQALLLLRTSARSLIANEQQISGATVLQFRATPLAPGATTADEQPEKVPVLPILVAISSDMVVIGSDRAQLIEVLERDATHTSAPAGSLATDPEFLAARRSLPKELNGIFYTDFSRVRWDGYIQALHEQMAKQRQKILDRADAIERGGKAMPDAAGAAQLRGQAEKVGGVKRIVAELLPLAAGYLKTAAGGSWKASDGVFLDSFVD